MFALEMKKENYTAPVPVKYSLQKFNLTVSFKTQSEEADFILDF